MIPDDYRKAVDENIAESAKRQALLNKGLLDPNVVLLEAEEADLSGERANRREMQEHREALQQGQTPVSHGEFDAFVGDMQRRFNALLDIVASHLKRIEKLEHASLSGHADAIVEDGDPAPRKVSKKKK